MDSGPLIRAHEREHHGKPDPPSCVTRLAPAPSPCSEREESSEQRAREQQRY
jgi:hypothetical protein